jgi:aldose 1-epimerase
MAAVAATGFGMAASALTIDKAPFGTADGIPVDLYTLKNDHGITLKVTNYGGTVTSLVVPDKKGVGSDIVLGFSTIDGYTGDAFQKANPYFGALIGRYGNRIGGAKFTLEGKEYSLAKNNGPNNLHGGVKGFDKKVWDAKEVKGKGAVGVELTYVSTAGEEGFPGDLTAKVTYWLTDKNELKIDYTATTDTATICNLTHHSYFNLGGEGSGDILGTDITLHASKFTPVDSTLIPTGELKDVEKTPFDFRKATTIGARINDEDTQLKYGKGYDHNWVIDRKGATGLVLAATAYDSATGRAMDVLTTEPGIQLYSGNFLDGSLVGKSGKPYVHRSGFCLETQHYPDSPNKPEWPTTELKPGQTYKTTTVYKFYTRGGK